MTTLQDVIPLLRQCDYMTALDMKDAYVHITIHSAYRHYPHFVVSCHHYQLRALYLEVTTTLRVFTKCPAVVTTYLRRVSIHDYPYFNDWLIKSAGRQQCLAHIQAAMPCTHPSCNFSAEWPGIHHECHQVPLITPQGRPLPVVTVKAYPSQQRFTHSAQLSTYAPPRDDGLLHGHHDLCTAPHAPFARMCCFNGHKQGITESI